MKNRIMPALLFLGLSAGLSGCYDITTPQGILTTAGEMVQKGDLNGLKGLLSGDALASYGTIDGLKILETHLMNRSLKAQDPNELGSVGDASDYIVTYSDSAADFAGTSPVVVLDAMIDCHTETPALSPIEGNTTGTASTQCSITQIQLKR